MSFKKYLAYCVAVALLMVSSTCKAQLYYKTKVVGLNFKRLFKRPGAAGLTSASQLKYFNNYLLPVNWPLRSKPVYNGKYGIKT